MHLICPSCRSSIEWAGPTPTEEVHCPACGSSFRLEAGSIVAMAPPPAGSKVGRFELLSQAGAGSFGTVWKARDPDLGRVVALKVPRAGALPGEADSERFLREARSAAQLRHPSIVAVHEVGRHDGLPYLVSEFVEGITLADLLSARRPSPAEAARLAAAIADALQYAHEQGVIHRDIKPSNILLGPEGKPHLTDFGLARCDNGEATLTVDGQVLGTPAYMSPEQARGEGHTVDGRSDVYSLGVVLYQMLTGVPPFRGTSRMLLHQVLYDDPKPPRRLEPAVPRDLETICLKAMAKEPARRYPTARELAEDLRRFLNGEPILARPPGALERAARWVKRRREVVWAAAGVVVTAGICLGLIFAFSQRSPEAPTPPDDGKQPVEKGSLPETPKDSSRSAERKPAPPAPLPPDLALVPPETFGFVVLDVASLRRSQAAGKLMQHFKEEQMPKISKEVEQAFGVTLADVERVVIFLLRSEKEGRMSDPLVVVTTAAAAPRARVLEKALGGAPEERKEGTAVYHGRAGCPRAVHFASERTFLVGPEAEVRRVLKPRTGPGPWSAALRLAADKHLVVAGVYPPEFMTKWLSEDLVRQKPDLKGLMASRAATVAVDLGDQGKTRLSLNLEFPEQATPQENEAAVRAAIKLLHRELTRFLQDLHVLGDPDKSLDWKEIRPLLASAAEGFRDAVVERDGGTVRATVRISGEPVPVLVAMAAPSLMAMRSSAARVHLQNNLKHLAIALLNYKNTHGAFPPPAIYGKNGQPLLSWRVLILPFLEEDKLYKEFHLDEPWNSPHNKKLLAKMPAVFASPDAPDLKEGMTYYQAFVGKGTVFEGPKGATTADIPDGTSNTLLAAEAARAVGWTKPEDLSYVDGRPLPALGLPGSNGFHVIFADGSVRFVRRPIDEETLRRLILRNDGKPIEWNKVP